jgi:GNAT superfamily N-acetyltransferase
MVAIERINSLPLDLLQPLVDEAESVGFRAPGRLVADWHSGRNRFDGPGEALFVAREGGLAVGVCRLNRDPCAADPLVDRVRHLYVVCDRRREGVGTRLVSAVVESARGRFARLRLRTSSPVADAFYRSLGFMPVADEPDCTHRLVLDGERRGILRP